MVPNFVASVCTELLSYGFVALLVVVLLVLLRLSRCFSFFLHLLFLVSM